MSRVLVTGAGGFIGHHLVKALKRDGAWVRGVDIRRPQWEPSLADEFEVRDLRDPIQSLEAMRGIEEVYALAADMGGMGYIAQNHATILRDNLRIDVNTIEAARAGGVSGYLYASSACVYPERLQTSTEITGLREEDAYPAQPAEAYGWEKLIGEKLCHHYHTDFDFPAHVVRMHNIFGPLGTWDGGREKAPAALCRKIATAKLTGETAIEIWGDGEQTRSFCYVDDCVEGLRRLMTSDYFEPVNLGQERLISINDLALLIAQIAGIPVTLRHVGGFQGVRGRNSDSALAARLLGWSPGVSLEDGLTRTYAWIEARVAEAMHGLSHDATAGSMLTSRPC